MKEIFDIEKLQEIDICSDIAVICPFEDTNIRIESSSSVEGIDPYFKLFLGNNIYYPYDDNMKMCRISMIHPEYIIGIGSDLVLTQHQILLMNELFKKENQFDHSKNNWEYLIFCYKQNMKNQYGFVNIPDDLSIPDYFQLH